jgi:hypothetical protein
MKQDEGNIVMVKRIGNATMRVSDLYYRGKTKEEIIKSLQGQNFEIVVESMVLDSEEELTDDKTNDRAAMRDYNNPGIQDSAQGSHMGL